MSIIKLIKSSKTNQMSDSFIISAFLALSGGFQDAYTYNIRNHVFSNAQTGNIVLMSQKLMEGRFSETLKYIFPLLAFILGVITVCRVRDKFQDCNKIHWRQIIVAVEIIMLFFVGFISINYNTVATVIVSFSCAMQVQAFRKVHGYSYASTMCIGNMRSGSESLYSYIKFKNTNALKKSLHYFGVILFFAIGAGIGGLLTSLLGISAIWVCCILLFIVFVLMFSEL